MRHRLLFRTIGILLILLILLAFITSLFFYQELRTAFEDEIRAYGSLGLFLGGFIVDTVGGPLGPEITVATGMMAGIHLPTVLLMVSLGSTAASLLVYGMGLLFGEYARQAFISMEQYEKWQTYFLRHGRLALALGALTPVPYVTICLIGGIFKVRLWEFLVFAVGCRYLRILGVAYILFLFKV